MRRQISSPSNSGIIQSRMTSADPLIDRRASIAAGPLLYAVYLNPHVSKALVIANRGASLSSATMIGMFPCCFAESGLPVKSLDQFGLKSIGFITVLATPRLFSFQSTLRDKMT